MSGARDPAQGRDALDQTLHAAQVEVSFNPLSPEFIRNPYPHYHRLRESDPVHRSPLGFFVASRHEDVSSILRDKRFGKDFVGRMTRRHGEAILQEPVYRSMRHWMLQQDPPDHTRLRGLVVKAHGNSSRRAIGNAVRLAARGVDHRVVERLAERLPERRPSPSAV